MRVIGLEPENRPTKRYGIDPRGVRILALVGVWLIFAVGGVSLYLADKAVTDWKSTAAENLAPTR